MTLAGESERRSGTAMNAQNYMADQIVRMAESYSQFVESTPTEKLTWKPEAADADGLRTILEQVSECVAVNNAVVELLNGRPYPPMSDTPVPASATEARAMLTSSAANLAQALQTLSDEDIDKTYPHPRALMHGTTVMMMAYRNMAYHCGQLNLFQMLYGDPEFHAPTNWR
jgi:DinB superfamily